MVKDTGGSAFPRYTIKAGYPVLEDGMTLRDYFAGMAFQALIPTVSRSTSDSTIATYAYNIADAMIAERNK